MARKWKKWPARFAEKIESTSGAVAAASGMTALGGAIVAGPLGAIVGGIGLALSLAYAGFKSVPPKSRASADLLGQHLPLDDLFSLEPPPLRLAVVGASQSGKSTFLSALQHSPKPPARTNKISAEILMLPGNPPKYIALLDADGAEFLQQFEIIKEADFLIFFVDHNETSEYSIKSSDRLAEHDRFIVQVEPALKKRGPLPKVHLLFNKRDLWENGTDSAVLRQWFESHAADWQRINVATDFTFGFHSNEKPQDIAKMMEIVRNFTSLRA